MQGLRSLGNPARFGLGVCLKPIGSGSSGTSLAVKMPPSKGGSSLRGGLRFRATISWPKNLKKRDLQMTSIGQPKSEMMGSAPQPVELPSPRSESSCAGLSVRQILVPLDGSKLSQCTLPYVVALGKAYAANVTLLQVLGTEHTEELTQQVDALEWELARVERQSSLGRIEEQIKSLQVEATSAVVQGKPAEQILHYAHAHDADLIVLSSHGEGGLSRWKISSTAQKVVAGAHTSILIVPARPACDDEPQDKPLKRILLPLDCSQRAECVLPAAMTLARTQNAELMLLHIVAEPEMPRRVAPSQEDHALAEALIERNQTEAKRYLREVQARLAELRGRVEVRTVVAHDRQQALQEIVSGEEIDLVMLAAHGHGGDSRRVYGGFIAPIIEECAFPVMVFQDFAYVLRDAMNTDVDARPGH